MSPDKNRVVVTARAEIEHLLFMYRGEVGAGKMDRAALTIAEVVRRLLDLISPVQIVEAAAPAPKPIETKFNIEVGGMAPEDAKKFMKEQLATVVAAHADAVAAQAAATAPAVAPEAPTEPVDAHSGGNPAVLADMPSEAPASANPPPCAPCDVSIPNNPDLIEDFKAPVEGTAAPAPKTPKKPKAADKPAE